MPSLIHSRATLVFKELNTMPRIPASREIVNVQGSWKKSKASRGGRGNANSRLFPGRRGCDDDGCVGGETRTAHPYTRCHWNASKQKKSHYIVRDTACVQYGNDENENLKRLAVDDEGEVPGDDPRVGRNESYSLFPYTEYSHLCKHTCLPQWYR
jgi:hypothetical protein